MVLLWPLIMRHQSLEDPLCSVTLPERCAAYHIMQWIAWIHALKPWPSLRQVFAITLAFSLPMSVQVICDHLGLGVKTGKPYIWHSKASNPFCQPEEGIPWHFLAGGHYSLL